MPVSLPSAERPEPTAGAPSAPAPETSSPASYPPPPPNATPAQEQEYLRGRWNHFLTDATWRRTRFNAEPNPLLVETVRRRRAGAALDVNMGEGRNALYLARQGWQVTGVDFADQALAFARQRAGQLGVQLTAIHHDTATYNWGTACWDLLVLCYADDSAHVARVHSALKPGGLLVFENFHADVNQAWGRQPGQEVGFATDELRDLYAAAGFQIVRYEEPMGVADFSRETHRLVKLVALKR
jgi:SAM-dependent methyltransferase